ncbi:MAG: tRNA 2-thiouridine(34) synthase MnmA [Actinobacteria bacterium]|nr:tRNA 2-thiouridine(34) synthase MnmA [Actinomycetota bacterium]MBM3712812.1 tRNA 2-thiouridine(34) synthase MnmA [Actinomycetota bacterium]
MNKQLKLKKIGKVAVALSGGIDSAAAAYLLKKKGFDIFGVILKLDNDSYFKKNFQSVDKICRELQIKKYILDLSKVFQEKIIEHLCTVYLEGRTPNPCVECNKLIKFGLLLEKIRDFGASYLATGHYARIKKSKDKDFFELKKGLDKIKDQSYFLWKLNQGQLSQIIFPLGNLCKSHVKKVSFEVFPFLKYRKESQEICFLKGTNYKDFLIRRLKIKKNISSGKIINSSGLILGTHKGYPFYTIGQRKGLGVSHSRPLYVKDIIPEENIIIVGEEAEISNQQFYVHDLNFISGEPPALKFNANTKIRYNSYEQPAKIHITRDDKAGDRALIKFTTAQKAVTPGQSAVFYQRETLLGGGIIK